MSEVLAQPLWLAGLSVQGLLQLLAQRPREFVVLEREAGRHGHDMAEWNCHWPQQRRNIDSTKPVAGWRPSLRKAPRGLRADPGSGGQGAKAVAPPLGEKTRTFRAEPRDDRGAPRAAWADSCGADAGEETHGQAEGWQQVEAGRGVKQCEARRAAVDMMEKKESADYVEAATDDDDNATVEGDEAEAAAAASAPNQGKSKQLKAAEEGGDLCREAAAHGADDGQPKGGKSKNKKKRKAEQAAVDDAALDLAILAAQREAAEEQQIVREVLTSRLEGPCGHEVVIAPKSMKGAASCACCGSTDVSFCCRLLGNSCGFRACRRCFLGDLKEQRRRSAAEAEGSIEKEADSARPQAAQRGADLPAQVGSPSMAAAPKIFDRIEATRPSEASQQAWEAEVEELAGDIADLAQELPLTKRSRRRLREMEGRQGSLVRKLQEARGYAAPCEDSHDDDDDVAESDDDECPSGVSDREGQ